MRKILLTMVVASLLPAGASNIRAASATNLAVYKPFMGIGYSPFQGDQSPNYGSYPSINQITYDLTNSLQYLASEIRTFGMDGTLSNIPALCSQYGIPCWPCAYLRTNNLADNDYELNALIAVGNSGYATTCGLVVGTEAMQSGYDPQTLINNINAVRAATGGRVPVGTSDVTFKFIDNPAVVANCDFVMVNIYAYWAEQPLSNAVAWTLQEYRNFTNYFPGKRVLIGEVNWPSSGGNIYWSDPNVVTSVENQGIFLGEFVQAAKANNIEYFILDYRDEAWKAQEAIGDVEENWGLYYTNGVKKQSLANFQTSGFMLQARQGPPGNVVLTIPTYEGNPYYLYQTPGLHPTSWSPRLSFTGASGTNQTLLTLPTSGNPVLFFGAGQAF